MPAIAPAWRFARNLLNYQVQANDEFVKNNSVITFR